MGSIYGANTISRLSDRYASLLGLLSAAAVVMIWSGWIVSSRWGITTTFAPIDLTWLRFATAALVTLPLSLRYPWRQLPIGKALVIALGCGFPYVWLVYGALKLVPSANASVLINGLLPVITSVIAWVVLGGRIRWPSALLIFVIVASAWITAYRPSQFSWSYMAGISLLLIATTVLAAYMVAVKAWNITLAEIMAWVPLLNAVLLLPFWLAYSEGIEVILRLPTANLIFHVVYQGVVVSVVALFLFSYAIKTIGALGTSLFMALVPSVTAVLAMFCCGEQVSQLQWTGILLCCTCLIAYSLLGQSQSKSDA